MSIINEALKKAQSQMEKKQPPVFSGNVQEEKNTSRIMTALIIIGFLSCVSVFFSLMKTNTAPIKGQALEQSPVAIAAKRTPVNPSSSSSVNELTLNGIIAMDGEQLALINNQIYKEGDRIGGKRILSIAADRVEIFGEGGIITLTTKN